MPKHHCHLDRSLLSLSVGISICLFGSAIASGQSFTCGVAELPSTSIKIYPPIAQAAHVSGTVVLIASFDHDGTPKVTHIITGPEMLKGTAAQLIEESKASPSNG